MGTQVLNIPNNRLAPEKVTNTVNKWLVGKVIAFLPGESWVARLGMTNARCAGAQARVKTRLRRGVSHYPPASASRGVRGISISMWPAQKNG